MNAVFSILSIQRVRPIMTFGAQALNSRSTFTPTTSAGVAAPDER
jgi:hypothetical protein